jgi:NAD(P)-dependent dehydrogenase (short-subunit alcohol dehydrogenase family)
MRELTGRNAIVTGGAVRLGRAIALRLAREGVNVCIHYATSSAAAEATLRDLQTCGIRASAVSADFAADVASGARRVMDEASKALGPIDLLVNSAAIFEPGTLDGMSDEPWERCFNINLKAPVWLAREFARQLPPAARGDIVNIVDWRALRPRPGHLAYTLAKAGLASATKLLAQELGPRIHVNGVAPGAILPPPGAGEDYLETLRERIPLKRTGDAEDVADAVVYLASSSFVSGEILSVTGGEQL